MSAWYYMDGGQQKGPINDNDLRNLISSGRLYPEDLVWCEGMAEWSPAHSLDGIVWPARPPQPPPPRFNQPPQHYSSANAHNMVESVPNYLPWSIAATILCCVPTGIAAIVYSTKATNAESRGDYLTAHRAAGSAKLWLILSVILGLIVGVLVFAGAILEEL